MIMATKLVIYKVKL